MRPAFTISQISTRLKGKAIPGAEDRQKLIPGFDQAKYSASHVLCIGAGGLISHIAPALVRKGIGKITLLDRDIVEVSNLNRQRFYERDIGKNKAIAMARNLQKECIGSTEIVGYATTIEEAILRGTDLSCDVAVCGVDNNLARVAACRFFRPRSTPVIFTAVSRDADHGYVFIQDSTGPCIGCLFPDIADDDHYPCPGTPALIDILQLIGSLSVYAIDTILTGRKRAWNYRRVCMSDRSYDGAGLIRNSNRCLLFTDINRQ